MFSRSSYCRRNSPMKKNGPYEFFHENGQLAEKGAFNMGEQCGEWVENGETITYDPCPPDLEDGN